MLKIKIRARSQRHQLFSLWPLNKRRAFATKTQVCLLRIPQRYRAVEKIAFLTIARKSKFIIQAPLSIVANAQEICEFLDFEHLFLFN